MDPIKPFTTLIRSLRRSDKSASNERTVPADASTGAAANIAASPAVHDRLQSRLATLAPWDAKRARELFVETTLLHEFGAELAADPAFFELVQRVSLHLSGETTVSDRLDGLLRELAAHRMAR
jgi:hypothetical protein